MQVTSTRTYSSPRWRATIVAALTAHYQGLWEAAVGTEHGPCPRILRNPGIDWAKVATHSDFWTRDRSN